LVNETTLLVDLDGVSVVRVEGYEDGGLRVHLATADVSARACLRGLLVPGERLRRHPDP
jgi:hypothetical protein